MNQPIGLTPSEIFAVFLGFCAAIVTVSAAVTIIIKIVQKAKQPEKNQNERLDEIEKRMKRFDELFDKDNKRLYELEEGNRVIQQALLALLSHSINGNDTENLIKARDHIQSYLISKGTHIPESVAKQ